MKTIATALFCSRRHPRQQVISQHQTDCSFVGEYANNSTPPATVTTDTAFSKNKLQQINSIAQ
ncbi:hypothetical protein [Lacibacter cauensis]|uniref:hypothetical protein n=1 Tax=Lacibacter cauensis TaxID=510947 RepID=UPI00119CF30F|nr:hypothetical protein [Lacibacter cauensis]